MGVQPFADGAAAHKDGFAGYGIRLHRAGAWQRRVRSLLLSGSTLSVTDIAEEIGLELYYFSRMFPKWSGFSPT